MTTSSTNYTGLYSGGVTTPIPNTAYGNANVVSLLAAGSDGANTVGNISATGNIVTGGILTDNYYYANGAPFSGGGGGTYGNANVANFLANYGSNTLSTTGNVTSGNVLTSGVVSATGNVRGGNINTVGIVSATGGITTADGVTATANISGANVIGNIYTASITGTVSNGNIDIAPDGTGHVNINADTLRVGDNNQPALIASRGTGNLTLQAHEGDTTQSNVRIVEGPSGNVEINLDGTGNLNVARISASGNITGSYFFGNGSQLTGIATSYGNANVATLLANFGSNSISTTGNVTAGYFIGNGSALTSLTGANVTGTVANATYAVSAGSATTAVTVTASAQPNITSVGTLTSLSSTGNIQGANLITGGLITATGNISGSNINGAVLSATGNIVGANVNVISNVAIGGGLAIGTTSFPIGSGAELFMTGNAAIGNIATGGLSSTYSNIVTDLNVGNAITVAGAIYAYGSNIFAGAVTVSPGNVTGGNLVSNNAVAAGTTISAAGNITGGNIRTAGQVSATGNITGGNIIGTIVGSIGQANVANYVPVIATSTSTPYYLLFADNSGGSNSQAYTDSAGQLNYNPSSDTLAAPFISASGNITAGTFFIGNGSQLTGITSTLPSTISVTGNITGGNINTAGQVSATGNVTGGNIVINGSNMQSKNAWDPNTSPQTARITVGTGYNGDYSTTYDPVSASRGSQLAVINKQTIGNADTNQGMRLTTSTLYADLGGGTLTNNNRRISAFYSQLYIGNGTQSMTQNGFFGASGGGTGVAVGNIGSVTMGNATVSHVTGVINNVALGTGGNVGNAVGSLNTVTTFSATGNVTTAIGSGSYFAAVTTPSTPPTTVIGYYMPSTTNNYGISSSNSYRGASNYYFLLNDDAVAQNQLGSLRSYTEFNGVSGTTSGALTIDKTAGQVQQVNLAGNITSLGFSNFVSSASDGTNTDEQSDTVTIIFNQGATGGYGVTFPSGSTYKYAGNVTSLQSTAANSVSLVSVSAIRLSATTTYLITISPGFV